MWLNMEKWLLMDERPEARSLLEYPRPRALRIPLISELQKTEENCLGQVQVKSDILQKFTERLLTKSPVLNGGLPRNFLNRKVPSTHPQILYLLRLPPCSDGLLTPDINTLRAVP